METSFNYSEQYKTRTEEIKKVLRKDDQTTIDYRIYNEAAKRVTKEKSGSVLLTRFTWEMLLYIVIIFVPFLVVGHYTGRMLIVGIGGLLMLGVMGIRGFLLGSIGMHLWDYLMIGNPYINGKIPHTRNSYLRKYIYEYKLKTEVMFNELKKDQEKTLDAITYDYAALDSIGDIEVFKPLITSIVMFCFVIPFLVIYQILLPPGDVKVVIEVMTLVIFAVPSYTYALIYTPIRTDIRRMIRSDNPYKVEK